MRCLAGGFEHILDYVTLVVSIPELMSVVREIRHYITVCKHYFC